MLRIFRGCSRSLLVAMPLLTPGQGFLVSLPLGMQSGAARAVLKNSKKTESGASLLFRSIRLTLRHRCLIARPAMEIGVVLSSGPFY